MYKDKLKKLTKQLYPTGRAFNLPFNGIIERLHDALIISENQMYSDAASTLDVILPDNNNFTSDDATRWEQRLGLITNLSVSLDDRKQAIIRKMNHPGTILARQSWDYLQDSLQLAGFDVYVHENIPEQNIIQILSLYSNTGQQGNGQQGYFQQGDVFSAFPNLFNQIQQGDLQQGMYQQGSFEYSNKIVNNIDEVKDSYIPVGSNFRSVFFVGGQTLGTFADIDANRKDEFRQLILKIKPVQSFGLLFINYI
ncbi:MAG: hypothetical protein JKY43_04580 [Phycisphaerales bacterium]|nr:hypothetical protein [Phycisphaerales bacterium]